MKDCFFTLVYETSIMLLQHLHRVHFWVSSHQKIFVSIYVGSNILCVIQYIKMCLIDLMSSYCYNILTLCTLTSVSIVMTRLRKPNRFDWFKVLLTKFNGFFNNVPFNNGCLWSILILRIPFQHLHVSLNWIHPSQINRTTQLNICN